MKSDEEHQKLYTDAVRQVGMEGGNAFQSWFNRSENIHQSVTRGFWDMTIHILTPQVCALLKQPEEKTALEIGYGGGRILNAACNYFKSVIGVDIHSEQDLVENFLHSQGKTNFLLLRTSGRTLDVDRESIDFIYSFIVLQHLPSLDVLQSYIQETYRCLKPKGVAQLYFGKYSKIHWIEQARSWFKGYKVISNAPVNFTSLVVRVALMKRLCRNTGLRVFASGTSYKQVPDGYPLRPGGQNFVSVVKLQ
jgi:SAM-dependent methyltransferase